MRRVLVAVALAASCASQPDGPPTSATPADEWIDTAEAELVSPPSSVDVAVPGEHDGHLFLAAPDAWALLATDPSTRPYALHVSPAVGRPMAAWGMFRVCADADGGVSSVDVRKSAGELLDSDWVQSLRTWRFRPLVRDGKATPFCSDLALHVMLR